MPCTHVSTCENGDRNIKALNHSRKRPLRYRFAILLQMSLFLQHWLQQSTRTAIDMLFMNLLSCERLACTDLVYTLSLCPPCLFFRLLVFLSLFLFCLSV